MTSLKKIMEKQFKNKINENSQDSFNKLMRDLEYENDHTGAALISAIYNGELNKAKEIFPKWVKREEQGHL